MVKRTVGQRLEKARTNAGLTQRELATRLGVSQGLVSHWERGSNVPGRDLAWKLYKLTSSWGDPIEPDEW